MMSEYEDSYCGLGTETSTTSTCRSGFRVV